jgi:hypothetical protein
LAPAIVTGDANRFLFDDPPNAGFLERLDFSYAMGPFPTIGQPLPP